jgi:hypothetical protein
MKKTAMQELYDWVEQRDFYISKECLKVLLEKEKEQIIQAWIVSDNPLQRMEAEKYYNITYKQE